MIAAAGRRSGSIRLIQDPERGSARLSAAPSGVFTGRAEESTSVPRTGSCGLPRARPAAVPTSTVFGYHAPRSNAGPRFVFRPLARSPRVSARISQ